MPSWAKGQVVSTGEARSRLAAYQWPGNMREMKNTVRGAVLLTPDGERIAAGSLAFSVREADGADASETLALNDAQKEKECIMRALEETGGNRKGGGKAAGNIKGAHFMRNYGSTAFNNRVSGFRTRVRLLHDTLIYTCSFGKFTSGCNTVDCL